jgi:hypothetical protein
LNSASRIAASVENFRFAESPCLALVTGALGESMDEMRPISTGIRIEQSNPKLQGTPANGHGDNFWGFRMSQGSILNKFDRFGFHLNAPLRVHVGFEGVVSMKTQQRLTSQVMWIRNNLI